MCHQGSRTRTRRDQRASTDSVGTAGFPHPQHTQHRAHPHHRHHCQSSNTINESWLISAFVEHNPGIQKAACNSINTASAHTRPERRAGTGSLRGVFGVFRAPRPAGTTAGPSRRPPAPALQDSATAGLTWVFGMVPQQRLGRGCRWGEGTRAPATAKRKGWGQPEGAGQGHTAPTTRYFGARRL